MIQSPFSIAAFLLFLSALSCYAANSDSPVPATSAPAAAAVAKPKSSYSEVNVDGPFLAITFDDGPHAKNTPKLLDLLAEKHIKATFFVLGENATRQPEIIKRIASEGHEIANHTWTHLNFAKSS